MKEGNGPERVSECRHEPVRIWAAVRGMLGESELKAFIST